MNMKRLLVSAILVFISAGSVIAQDYDRSAPFPQVTPSAPTPGSMPGQVRGGAGNAISNGDFELNGGVGSTMITDWTVVSVTGSLGGMGGGNFVAYSGTTAPISMSMVEAPTEGAFAVISDTGGPSSHIIYQDVSVPSAGAILSCDVFFLNQSGTNINAGNLDHEGGPNQHARIDVMDPGAPVDDTGAGVLQNLFITEAVDPAALSYFNLQANLSTFAGQTVRLRFAEVNNQFFQNLGVDNCRLAAPQVIPVMTAPAIAALITAVLLFGFILIRRRQQS